MLKWVTLEFYCLSDCTDCDVIDKFTLQVVWSRRLLMAARKMAGPMHVPRGTPHVVGSQMDVSPSYHITVMNGGSKVLHPRW